ncbi:hypothetical protein AArcSl_1277 [Halalkaliarchaeum desulfuricum]|uniref:Uncharacterized protein n=1 Tax=Halalkaliarchaeum desulfuricum TaxID=2055893 RepID=A0A343TII6_9EURY|nr:LamG-like jellyroll fold domain-containing protein [Halalkaliarchaeum desulfuricum]AUX08908.1 hypothetical protein AArcSl_1277 [Halalkaliarchaeum desulfuricum]
MSGYELSIGGPRSDDDADVYADFVDFDVTEAASSMGSWGATLPFRASFEDELLSKVWIYHQDEIIFRGELESFEADYESSTTEINGRGIFVEMNRKTSSVHYEDTTVYDAIVDFWDETDWDALVLPPNREVRDTVQVSEFDHAAVWSWEGTRDGDTRQDDVELVPNRFEINEPNILVDETEHDDSQASLSHDDETDVWWVLIETDEPVNTFDVGIHQQETWSSDGIYEEAWDSVDHNTPQRFHLFRLEFDSEWDQFRPKLQIYDETFDIVRSEIFIPDESGYSTLDGVEIDGTQFEILQELHDIGSYEFNVNDYETLDVHSFPTGTLNGEPDWRITSSNRSKDLTDYANRVTVHGRTGDDGSTPKATAENQDEIDDMAQRGIGDDGVVERFEKNPELTTQEEVDSRAERFLRESVNERDESGSLEIVPQQVAPGYSYNVSAWGDSFPYGSQIGSNSLYFRGPDSPGDVDDHVVYSWSNLIYGSGGEYTWEFLVHPQDLADLGDDEYYTIFEFDEDEAGTAYVRLYGDGSIQLDYTSTTGDVTRTDMNTIREGDTQRLTILWSEDVWDRYFYVDGQLEYEDSAHPPWLDLEYGDYYVGADRNGENGFKGGIDDVRIFASSEWKSQEWIRQNAYADLVEADEDLEGLLNYLRFDDHSDTDEVRNDGTAMYFDSEIVGAEYQEKFGKLDEVQYSLGDGDTLSLDFDISGRIDTELVSTQRSARTNRRSL